MQTQPIAAEFAGSICVEAVAVPLRFRRTRLLVRFAVAVWLVGVPIGCRDNPPPPKASPNGSPVGSSTGPKAGQRGAAGPATSADCARWEALKNLGIGQLENTKYDEAAETLAALAEQVPDEVLPHRNLALAHVLALVAEESQKEQPDRKDQRPVFPHETRVSQAEASVQKLLQVDPQSSVSHLLAARLSLMTRRLEQAAASFQKAAELAPDDPAILYQVSEFAFVSHDDPEAAAAVRLKTLQKLRVLRPDNMAICRMLAKEQSQNPGPELAATVKDLHRLAGWLGPSVKRHDPNNDLHKVFARADAAIAKQNWQLLRGAVGTAMNLLLPEPAMKNDLARLNPDVRGGENLLNWALLDFSDKYRDRCPVAAVAASDVDVKFVVFPSGLQLEEKPGRAGSEKKSSNLDLAVADVDLDGLLDLWLLQSDRLVVNSQSGALMRWKELVTFPHAGGFTRLIAADLDNDYPIDEKRNPRERERGRQPNAPVGRLCYDVDLDAILYGPAGVKVLRNDWDPQTNERKFADVRQPGEFTALRDVVAVAVADLDHDGDLDLAISSGSGVSLWSNRNDMTFVDISGESLLPPRDVHPQALLPLDWQRNLNMHVVVGGTDKNPAGLLENVVHGRFRWLALDAEFSAFRSATTLKPLEADANVSWDIVAGGPEGGVLIKTATAQPGLVRVRQVQPFTKAPLRGLDTLDFDNDGETDVVTWSEGGLGLFRGAGGELHDVSKLLADMTDKPLACVPGDLDRDGDLDLALLFADGVRLIRNDGANKNHWLTLRPRGRQDKSGEISASGRVNHYGLGSVIELRTGNRYHAQVVTRPETHFGLGSAPKADIARIIWTTGVPQNVLEPKADQEICEEQSLSGSCPFLYTWNGQRFEFVTDLLWNAPIGMLQDHEKFVPYRNWEYIKIPGEKLAPRDGKYVLQVTEELWEATYVDEVRLVAIDHPAEIDIYSNEKVGDAELAKFKVHTVSRPRLPVAARDKHGRDVLPIISKTDGQFLRGYDEKIRQGVTDEHYLELDLGKLDQPQKITLFLTGWIYPPTPSISIGLSQNPRSPVVRPPYIQVPDAKGNWTEVVPFMGFPGGKTKTIAVDLSRVFLAPDYRVRIVTSREIYWDSAFFTVDEEPSPFTQTELPLVAADVHFRGCSRRYFSSQYGPELFDYDQLETPREWFAMGGSFTRYGNVRELLTVSDDRFVIVGAGDEITLEFAAPDKPLPAGWKRDFLMYNVGYDKDCDRNTVYGQTVEPLPFAAMSGYPYGVDETYPETALHRETLRKYHTRRQDVRQFWRVLLPKR